MVHEWKALVLIRTPLEVETVRKFSVKAVSEIHARRKILEKVWREGFTVVEFLDILVCKGGKK